jgi:hypothetical protein
MRVGYAWLAEKPDVFAPQPAQYAETRSVTRKERVGACLAVPAAMAPATDRTLDHVLFALKHEGINLAILAQALPKIPEADLRLAYQHSPTSQFLRKACYLWEHFTGNKIARGATAARTQYVPLFDPDQYLTANGPRDARWRIEFNGLGNLDYCVTVQKSEQLSALLAKNLLQQAADFTNAQSIDILNRTLAWAYLDETRNSYAIENELPSGDKASRFVNLLKQAHHPKPLTEDYLVSLQNAAINNPYGQAVSFRTQQNYLSNGLRGALGVTYVPPDPDLSRVLMEDLMALANQPPADIDPLVLAAIISFGFVFIHPFMDGNGRLSRFLFHQVLCQQGALKNGLLLPVSSVLKQEEATYKATLEAYSAATRNFWQVTFLDEEQFHFEFRGHPAIYRYWDATACVIFMASAAEQALTQHLKGEIEYLNRYDAIYRRIDNTYDVTNADLAKLVMFCMDQQGRLSSKRRKQYEYKVPNDIFDALEQAYRDVMGSATEQRPNET